MLIELSVLSGLVVLLALGVPQDAITERVAIFALPYLNENLYLMMAMSGNFGALRATGAVAMARDRLWVLFFRSSRHGCWGRGGGDSGNDIEKLQA